MTESATAPESIEEKIREKIKTIASVADHLPAVIVLHALPEFKIRYMSPYGLKLLGKQWNDIQDLTSEEYHERFFNADDAREYVPLITEMLEKNTDEPISFFQQVRTSSERDWDWYMSSLKILLRDENNKPALSINLAQKIDPKHYFTSKAVRLLEENTFLRNHYPDFARLGKREKDVLKLMALGKKSGEIAKELHISVATAETHRKNIKLKLKARDSYALSQYARAFDLI